MSEYMSIALKLGRIYRARGCSKEEVHMFLHGLHYGYRIWAES